MKDCTIYKMLSMIGKKWTMLILLELYKGKNDQKQFNELKNKVSGITPKVLAQRLKELEAEGIITRRTDSSSVPIKCFYSLTESGEALIEVIHDIKLWGLKWKVSNEECMATECKFCIL